MFHWCVRACVQLLLKLLDSGSVPATEIETLKEEFVQYLDEEEDAEFYETDWYYDDLADYCRDNGVSHDAVCVLVVCLFVCVCVVVCRCVCVYVFLTPCVCVFRSVS